MNHRIPCVAILIAMLLLAMPSAARRRVYEAAQLGVVANTGKSQSAAMMRAIERIASETKDGDKVVFRLTPGRYDFYPEDAAERTYYVSNHDQTVPKRVGVVLEGLRRFTLDGQGAQIVCHGRMMPLAMVDAKGCTLKNLSIDFHNPQISQIEIVSNHPDEGITFRPSPEVDYEINDRGDFLTRGQGWQMRHQYGIAFEGDTRHMVYNTSDLHCPIKDVRRVDDNLLQVPTWRDSRLKPGTHIALRGWERPAPGIFMYRCRDTRLIDVRVHYAEGMGLLAQMCEDITMQGFCVCLKGTDDTRYFTTQADATHFSGCKGKITSVGGLYEGMMDDAINVHGTYLKVTRRIDDHTLEGRYMHGQTYGFDWGYRGDEVQFVRSASMDILEGTNRVESIEQTDLKTFRIRFSQPVPQEVSEQAGYGIENLTWTPEVVFARNTVRNNRARGALFSTPRRVVVENNLFDHTSGCAILLCGDCNGWYETGACRDVTIRRNRFVNALTSQFQFTNAIISIYPEIPQLKDQQRYFHGGHKDAIRIEHNTFETFDAPILYAKSVDGLLYRHNRIIRTTDYAPMHWNRQPFLLERVTNVRIEE